MPTRAFVPFTIFQETQNDTDNGTKLGGDAAGAQRTPPLVLVEFEALEERVSKPVCRPIADKLYEYGTLLWMASITAAIAACMAHL